ncbi:MAG: hypothetical protein GKR96_06200 [Gammaproteobacteria bacterium]|nr:hypothetical protein [Gammaproteobacteria bacterium]
MQEGAFVIVVPNSMAFRALVESNVLSILKREGRQRIVVISSANESRSRLPVDVEWRSLEQPCELPPQQSWLRRIARAVSVRVSKFGMDYGNLSFRFNHLCGFKAHKFKQQLGKERQKREVVAGNYVASKFGWPFPSSRWLYRFIYGLYYAKWQIPDRAIEQFFHETPIDMIVLWYVQSLIYRDYSICIRKHNLQAVGVIGSWDRPTTKGPICPGCDRYIVNSEIMKRELMTYHEVLAKRIDIVGWPQMDVYKNPLTFQGRAEFLDSIGVKPDHKLLLFAGNSERLGAHEPGIVTFLERRMNEGEYGENVSLLVRAHPNDHRWKTRFVDLIGRPNVTVMPGGMGNIALLASTLFHADIVIATQGSVSLDAVAFDKCVINIAFDGNLEKSYADSVSRWYEMDHYRPVVESGGVKIIRDFDELDQSIPTYLKNPSKDKDAREKLRCLELEPFDGRSSYRQAMAMMGRQL